jgi:DNA repair exonuclease SbcCD ATPase subunit
MVDRDVTKCQGCLSELTEEVKAFPCPKCQTVIALGEPTCPTCGLKFKVKALRPRAPAEDDKFLMKLIEWGKEQQGQKGSGEPESKGPAEQPAAESPAPSPPASQSEAQMRRLAELKSSINDLMANRSEMLERMERRLADEKARLAEISTLEGEAGSADKVEAEIMALADEMADITMLQAHMESLSDEISSLLSSVDVSDATKERGLAAKALRKKLEAKEREVEELRAKEEQLVKREEMVDRKIQAYAQKKRQLDESEADLQQKLQKLEAERAELDKLKATAEGARSDEERERAREAWMEEKKSLGQKIASIRSTVSTHRTGKGPEEEMKAAEEDIDAVIADLERQIGDLILEKVDVQTKMTEATMVDDDLKKLLKILDQMLGQLPEDVIERFSKSDEFALYERILDRFKI